MIYKMLIIVCCKTKFGVIKIIKRRAQYTHSAHTGRGGVVSFISVDNSELSVAQQCRTSDSVLTALRLRPGCDRSVCYVSCIVPADCTHCQAQAADRTTYVFV